MHLANIGFCADTTYTKTQISIMKSKIEHKTNMPESAGFMHPANIGIPSSTPQEHAQQYKHVSTHLLTFFFTFF